MTIAALRAARVAAALLLAAALAANVYKHVTFWHDWAFFDTLGYFSQQSNIVALAVLIVAIPFTGRARPVWLEYARASVVVYLVVVTAVYWLLLGGFEDGDPVKWSTLTMHGVSCAVMLADWLVEGPRRPLPVSRVWVVMTYPVLWVGVALARGATDGWVPYPFLDPADGYAAVAVIVGGLVVAGAGLGAVVFRLTRWRVVVPAAAGATSPS